MIIILSFSVSSFVFWKSFKHLPPPESFISLIWLVLWYSPALIWISFIFGAHFKTRLFFYANEGTFGELLNWNHHFLTPGIKFVTPYHCTYLTSLTVLRNKSIVFRIPRLTIANNKLTISFLCRCPLGPIMREIIKASATKLQIRFDSDVPVKNNWQKQWNSDHRLKIGYMVTTTPTTVNK